MIWVFFKVWTADFFFFAQLCRKKYSFEHEYPTNQDYEEGINGEINLVKYTPQSENYTCPACGFKINGKKDLQIHTDAKHDGISYGKY